MDIDTNIYKGKKILLFAPSFFGYEKEIKSRLEFFGAEVDFFDERPSNSFIVKVLIRLNKKLIQKKINNYYSDIISKTSNKKFDFVLFISPESINSELFHKLKAEQKDAKFILYLWDSLKNKKALEILDDFDKRLSFDKEDCENKAFNLEYRPLFYLDAYSELSKQNVKKEIDLLFIGTLHTDRFTILKEIKKQCEELDLKVYFYLYFPSRALYFFKKFFDKSLMGTKKSDFKFKALSKEDIIDLVNKSEAVLDVQSAKQSGLTMRTIEMLGAEKKMITTNRGISSYDFYESTNIDIIKRDNLKLNKSFFNNKYSSISEDVYRKYTINSWLNDLFS